jgi:3-methyladenine DNA glycosylase/8-oxoguanine DNA glycosylase
MPHRSARVPSLQLPDYARLKSVIERVRTIFDLGGNPMQIGRHLGRHPQMASVECRARDLQLSGAWDGFEMAVRVLVVRGVEYVCEAAAIGKLAAKYGQPFVAHDDTRLTVLFATATSLMQASLAGLGLSLLAAHRIQTCAQAVACGYVRFDPMVTFDEMVSSLTCAADLNLASAYWVAMRALGEPDASSFGAPSVPTEATEQWLDATTQEALGPWRSYAAVLLALPSAQ